MLKSVAKIKDFEKNVLSTKNILQYLITKKKKSKFIFLSSISVFGNNKLKKLRENNKILPISTYAKNKVKAEKLCIALNKKFNFDVLILRGTSIFGPGLNRQIIHDVCKKVQLNNNIFFGSGEEERDFLYIDDMCNFIQKVIKKSFTGLEIVHVGTGKGTKIKKIIRYINYKLKGKLEPRFNKLGLDINPNRLIPNIIKTSKYKWKPKVSLYKGIDNYIKWFLKIIEMIKLGFFIHFNKTWLGGINVILNLINLISEKSNDKIASKIKIVIFTNSKKKLRKFSINKKVEIIENNEIFDVNIFLRIIDKIYLVFFGKQFSLKIF